MPDPLDEHYSYLADRVKVARYRAAIDSVVRPGHVVLDLGCGSGLLGLLALRAGAGEVLFVDQGPVIEVARRVVGEAGYGHRATFYQARSFDLELAHRADVVLCDHVGYFGFDYDILKLLSDARQRFLVPGGITIPARIDVHLAPVESEPSRSLVQRWRDGSVPKEFAWVATPAANRKHAVVLEAGELIAEPARLATLELGGDAGEFFSWRADFTCARDATLDGLAGWFDCVLRDDIRMTNAPGSENGLNRPQAFLPLEQPIEVRAGQRIAASIMARPHDHVIAWTIELPDNGQQFRHSTFFGLELESWLHRMNGATEGA